VAEQRQEYGRTKPVMAGREVVVVADVLSCTLCGWPSKGHGERLGWGHLGDSRKRYVKPSPDLVARREVAKETGGRQIGGFNPITGTPVTHLVEATCRCGARLVATVKQADAARCTACLVRDIEEKGTSRA
jgi:hypothetical protein